jgi:hypothetical protein
MIKQIVLCLLATAIDYVLAGCATDHQAANDNTNYLENTSTTAHGEATVFYGHGVGHQC